MRVLMSAYACEPHKGSEPAVGWNWAKQAARYHEVWVLTRSNNQSAIESGLSEDPIPNLHFVFHDLPPWARRWKSGSRGITLYYLLWQLTAIPVARKLHKQIMFDVGHHVTLVAFRYPSLFAWLGIPYIWGPVGGGESAPICFYPTFGLTGAVKEMLRGLSNCATRGDPLIRLTAHRASIILATTPATAKRIPTSQRSKIRVVPAIGIDDLPTGQATVSMSTGTLRLLYVGNLLHWKGIHLAVHAIAKASEEGCDTHLTVVGDGPYHPNLEQLVSRLHLEKRIHFAGRVSRAEVLDFYRNHDAFVFPSLHDSGGFVVLEAMAAGLPVLCLDLGGPGLSVSDSTGIRIEASTPKQVIDALASQIQRLATHPEVRRELGLAGRRNAGSAYSWEQKGERLRNLYDELILRKGPSPHSKGEPLP